MSGCDVNSGKVKDDVEDQRACFKNPINVTKYHESIVQPENVPESEKFWFRELDFP